MRHKPDAMRAAAKNGEHEEWEKGRKTGKQNRKQEGIQKRKMLRSVDGLGGGEIIRSRFLTRRGWNGPMEVAVL